MKEKTKAEETERQEGTEEEPQVFAVQKDLNGWRFSRRDFLAAAGAAAAAIVAGQTTACTRPTPAATPAPVSPTSTATPMPVSILTHPPTQKSPSPPPSTPTRHTPARPAPSP